MIQEKDRYYERKVKDNISNLTKTHDVETENKDSKIKKLTKQNKKLEDEVSSFKIKVTDLKKRLKTEIKEHNEVIENYKTELKEQNDRMTEVNQQKDRLEFEIIDQDIRNKDLKSINKLIPK